VTSPGVPELLIILFIVLLFVGTKKLPGLASSIGTSIKEFRKTASDAVEDEDDTAVADDRGPAPVDGASPDRDAER
jgi:sec-independent protein translocase protein TatA